jgi:hypothetical protein
MSEEFVEYLWEGLKELNLESVLQIRWKISHPGARWLHIARVHQCRNHRDRTDISKISE